MFAYLVKKEQLGNPYVLLGKSSVLRVRLLPADGNEEGLAVPLYVINTDLERQKEMIIDADEPLTFYVTDKLPVSSSIALPAYVLGAIENGSSMEIQGDQTEEIE